MSTPPPPDSPGGTEPAPGADEPTPSADSSDGAADAEIADRENAEPVPLSRRPAVLTMLALIVVCIIGSLLMRSMNGWLNQTSVFYVGLPALLAALLVISRPSTSAYGIVLKGTTLFLLIAAIFAGEGVVCILFAAPLVYAVALLVAVLVKAARNTARGARAVVVPAILLAVASTEGAVPALTLPAENTVVAERIVAAPPEQVRAAVAGPLRFVEPTGLLALGFPRPLEDHSEGLAPGDARHIVFSGAPRRAAPLHGHHWGTAPSTLTLRVAAAGDRSVDYVAEQDDTPIATWLAWRASTVRWASADGGTRVTWSLTFERRLAPAAYWTPLERTVAQRAADYLVGSLALPG
ncbi:MULTISPECIES: SRPBCC family protein [Tsukamurella]|uniref:SRPBCC family protein n=2 Tax=Tsukamurella TaxID=2060 RepID=A0A5C5RZ01_9ACTN|nr:MULTISPECIES: SRPBCC family protein [Tsukamurella]NMD56258.1 SRPBCC family protein [Tsukamurella columbiensis]TWS27191.1 SRPBCC family protein [Tsukamurella conjunctivitidis]